ncbi:uncharacterized [Tachysurus ichikawai]
MIVVVMERFRQRAPWETACVKAIAHSCIHLLASSLSLYDEGFLLPIQLGFDVPINSKLVLGEAADFQNGDNTFLSGSDEVG